MARSTNSSSKWNRHQDRCYLKLNEFNIGFLIVGKRRSTNRFDWAAFLVDPISNEPISNKPYFYHEHLQSLYYELDKLNPAEAAALIARSSGRQLNAPQSSTTIINNVSIDARSLNIVNSTPKDCVDSMDWARIQCERMGWIEPPKTLLDKVSRIFNNFGSEEAVEHIMSEYHRAFALVDSTTRRRGNSIKGTSRMWADG